jgi:hypothetical protein
MNKAKNADKAKIVIVIVKNYNEKRKWRYYYDVTLTVGETEKSDGDYTAWKWQAIIGAKITAKELLRGKRKEVYREEIDVEVQ